VSVAEKESTLHRDALVAFHIVNDSRDPGVSWLMTNWLAQIKASRRISQQEKQAFGELFPNMPRDIEGGIINQDIIVIVAPLMSKNIISEDVLANLIKKDKPMERFSYKGYAGYHRIGEGKMHISAFALSKKYAVLASNSDYIKKTIDIMENKKERLSDDSGYKETLSLLPPKADIMIFANNKDKGFSRILKGWEKKWKMTVFLSAPYLDSMGLSFDVINEDKMKGMLAFKCSQKNRIPDVVDDARFLGEVLRRKFAKEKIKYTSKVTLKDNYVFLEVEISGMKPLWIMLFNQ